jgi:EAL domain-containing protein (putative c-di-GMP-specific phosphodiesterase class I)
MYGGTDDGRETWQNHRPEVQAPAAERRSDDWTLLHALIRQDFVLHYHPKVDLDTSRVVGVEASVCCHLPHHALVPLAQVMPIVAKNGLMLPIGRWVLREACRQAKAWQVSSRPPLSIAVNLSAAELRTSNFVAMLQVILAETGLEPSCLELELAEAFLAHDPATVVAVLRSLKDLGIQLTLDEFGTGVSSLNYLRRFPIDSLKIDRSFVRRLGGNDRIISGLVSSLIGLADNLHLRIAAEGVETREQAAFLSEHGCSVGQGHYFSQALAANEFTQLLERNRETGSLKQRKRDARSRAPGAELGRS